MKKKFIINEENRIVIAEMLDEPKTVEEEVNEKTSKSTSFIVNSIFHEFNMNKTTNPLYKAIARCDNRDDFDKNLGMEISAAKSDLKYHIAMRKKYIRVLRILRKACDEIERLAVKHHKKENNIKNDIERCFIKIDLRKK